MSVDIVVRSGDTQPNLQRTLYDSAGVPINLTGYVVTFTVTDPVTGTSVIDEPCAIVGDPTSGTVNLNWPNTVPTNGFFFAQFSLVSGAETVHVPNATPLSILFTNDSSHEYSYSGNPSLRTVDRIRFLVQDTDTAKALLSDAEIEFLSAEWKNPYIAAAEAATIIGTHYSNYLDKTVGPLSIKYGDQAQRYFSLSQNLRQRGSQNTGALAVITQVDRLPTFTIGMGDNKRGNTFSNLGGQNG